MKGEVVAKNLKTKHPIVSTLAENGVVSKRIDELSQLVALRAYELFERDGCKHGHALEHWCHAEAELLQPVPIEYRETDQNLIVKANIPGFAEDDVEVYVAPRRVVISGKKEHFDHNTRDIQSTEICQSIEIPTEVVPGDATAELTGGKLEITLPKASVGKKGPSSARAA